MKKTDLRKPLISQVNNPSREVERLQDKYEKPGQKCGNGHVNNLPIKLWDCPICTEKLRKEREWLIERASYDVYSYMYPTIEERKKYIIEEMQQALKEK